MILINLYYRIYFKYIFAKHFMNVNTLRLHDKFCHIQYHSSWWTSEFLLEPNYEKRTLQETCRYVGRNPSSALSREREYVDITILYWTGRLPQIHTHKNPWQAGLSARY